MQNLEEIAHLDPENRSNHEDQFEGAKKEQIQDSQALEIFTQRAIDAAGFGKFNLKVSFLSALVYINSAISWTSTGFILPAATCDFQMNTVDKGRITIAFMLGATFGIVIWGFVTDLKGRKYALILTLFLQGSSEFITSFITNYWCFLGFRFLSGLGACGQIALVFTYVGEFQPSNFRKRILSWLDMAWIIGLFIVPLLAWTIMPIKIEFVTGNFSFRSWNLFILICSLPALLIGTCLFFFSETPKFLANTQQYSKLLKVLTEMYEQNTGKAAKGYLTTLTKDGNPFTDEMIRLFLKNKNLRFEKPVYEKNLNIMLEDIKSQAVNVFHSHYLKKMIIVSVATFFLMSPYNTLILWFPEILERFARFENRYPNETSSFCIVTYRKGLLNRNSSLNNNPGECDRMIDNSVYINTLWLSAACVPPAILLPLLVDKVGFRFFLVPASIIGCLATLGLFFVKSSLQNMILSCILESATSIGISIIYCCLVVIFPTNFRVFAVMVAILTGRIGGFVGNLIFSHFVDDYCIPVILSVAIQLLLGAVLCYIL